MKAAFLGLGVMGSPMAGHAAKAGVDLRVYNRSVEKAQRWQATYSDCVAASVADAVADRDVVAVCLGADADVREVLCGEQGVFAHMPRGGVVVDHSTTSAELAREMAQAAAHAGLQFVDAPVSGGQAGAESGKLTIMAGGEPAAFAKAEPLLQCYAARYRLLGEVGSGQLAKMVNQICIAGLLQGLAEGMNFGQRAGLDMSAVVDVISAGAAQSWQMDNRAETMLAGEFDFGFAVDWMRKDLSYVLDEARRQGSSLPVTALVDQFYAQVQSLGGGRKDTSSLLLALQASQQHARSSSDKG